MGRLGEEGEEGSWAEEEGRGECCDTEGKEGKGCGSKS